MRLYFSNIYIYIYNLIIIIILLITIQPLVQLMNNIQNIYFKYIFY